MGSEAAAAEPHFTGSTVPFGLAAGLSGVAGSIAMGLGGYLAARSESEHYQAELERERYEIQHVPDLERAEVRKVLAGFGLKDEPLESAVNAVTEDDQRWLDFMMRNELNIEPPDPKRARNSAATIGFS